MRIFSSFLCCLIVKRLGDSIPAIRKGDAEERSGCGGDTHEGIVEVFCFLGGGVFLFVFFWCLLISISSTVEANMKEDRYSLILFLYGWCRWYRRVIYVSRRWKIQFYLLVSVRMHGYPEWCICQFSDCWGHLLKYLCWKEHVTFLFVFHSCTESWSQIIILVQSSHSSELFSLALLKLSSSSIALACIYFCWWCLIVVFCHPPT